MDRDHTIAIRIFFTKGCRQGLEHHTELDKVVENNTPGMGTVEFLDEKVVERVREAVA